MIDIQQIQQEQKAWSERNFGGKHGTGYRPLLGVMEEVGELAHAHLKAEQGIRTNQDHEAARVDAVGDILIYLLDYCNGFNIDMGECLEMTWNEVKQRNWKSNPADGKGDA